MDFVTSLPKMMKGCDSIWFIIDKLIKSTYLISIKISYLLHELVEVYIEKVVSLHGIHSSIAYDINLRSTSRFSQSLQEALGTKLELIYVYHPQTNSQTEGIIQYFEDLLRACILEQGSNWDSYLSLVELTYNNNFHSSVGIALF